MDITIKEINEEVFVRANLIILKIETPTNLVAKIREMVGDDHFIDDDDDDDDDIMYSAC